MDDRLDTEHVRRQVEQDGQAAQYQQHASGAELRLTAGESSCRWILLDVGEADLVQCRDRRR